MGTYGEWPPKKILVHWPWNGNLKILILFGIILKKCKYFSQYCIFLKNSFSDMFFGPCEWIQATLHIIFLTKKNYLYFPLKTYMGLMSLYRRWDTTKMTPEFIILTKSKKILLRWFSLKNVIVTFFSWSHFLSFIPHKIGEWKKCPKQKNKTTFTVTTFWVW